MSSDLPGRDDLRRAMTVEVVQEQADEDEPVVGDIETIVTDERTHPEGIEVKLESGVTGRVKSIAPDA